MAGTLKVDEIYSSTGTISLPQGQGLDLSDCRSSLNVPQGTTAQEVNPSTSGIRFNTENKEIMAYGESWQRFKKTVTEEYAISKSGLILYLDSENLDSYPGTGSSWYDIAKTNKGSLVGGTTYDSTRKEFVFDGSTGHILITSTALSNIGSSDHTISAWVNNDITTEEDFIGTGGTTNGHTLLMIYNQAGGGQGGFRGHVWSDTGSSNTIDSPNAIGTENWVYLTQRVRWGSSIEIFENGVQVNTQVLNGNPVSHGGSDFVIGARSTGATGSRFQGKIKIVEVYNRALSNYEIFTNFNALKERFGVV